MAGAEPPRAERLAAEAPLADSAADLVRDAVADLVSAGAFLTSLGPAYDEARRLVDVAREGCAAAAAELERAWWRP